VALLEAMVERQVTVEGITHELPRPFMVIATENPIEYEGVYPLPESQLDRFLIRQKIGYPDRAAEKEVVIRQLQQHPIEALEPVASADMVVELQQAAAQCHLADNLYDYVITSFVSPLAPNALLRCLFV
jgi:MoxR-like ATPase